MKTNILKVSIICLISIFVLILIFSAYFTDYNSVIKRNWGVSLPKGHRKESFSINSESGFLGDGQRYHVFNYKKGLKQNDIEKFNSDKNISVETEVKEILSPLELSQQKKPDFSQKYYWYKKNDNSDPRNRLYIIYVVKDNKLYVIEDFF